jgi:hypothetical protein
MTLRVFTFEAQGTARVASVEMWCLLLFAPALFAAPGAERAVAQKQPL